VILDWGWVDMNVKWGLDLDHFGVKQMESVYIKEKVSIILLPKQLYL